VNAADVIEVLQALESHARCIWIDGGWGVDALVGEQTRAHNDLDLAVDSDEIAPIERALAALGFRHDPKIVPGLPARLVLRDRRGRQVDVHPLFFDDDGNGWQQLSETGRAWGRYPAADLDVTGTIAGRSVQCLSPKLQFRFRLGHEWTERDEHDLELLRTRFDVGPVPPPFWR
jgi:lincosamide nucleotidyltransferase A/C/D/E